MIKGEWVECMESLGLRQIIEVDGWTQPWVATEAPYRLA
jgi:hypothetical protein